MGSSPGSSVASPRGRGARSSSFLISLLSLHIGISRLYSVYRSHLPLSRSLFLSSCRDLATPSLSRIVTICPGFPGSRGQICTGFKM